MTFTCGVSSTPVWGFSKGKLLMMMLTLFTVQTSAVTLLEQPSCSALVLARCKYGIIQVVYESGREMVNPTEENSNKSRVFQKGVAVMFAENFSQKCWLINHCSEGAAVTSNSVLLAQL